MFNNSNKILWIIFVILLIAVILVFTTESTKNEKSFKTKIVKIDTSKISSFSIFPKSQKGTEIKFLKSDGVWKVSKNGNESFTVPQNKINDLFLQLLKIKPKRLAARSKSKWKDYQVDDSSSTRVVINENGSEVLDLIIGKFAFQQPRSMSTFVRLNNENDVYEVDGFLEMFFNKDLNSFRNEIVINSNLNSWNKLSYSLNEKDNFELIKVDNKWLINGVKTDSAKTQKLLSGLSNLRSTDFIDAENFTTPLDELKITTENNGEIKISVYQNNGIKIIHSSQNPESCFVTDKLYEKIFFAKDSLF
ncbi:MAG: hypothetical protein CR986_04850 [Ignavibacteriae bacterium]|nr:MAG: hypothetical protein CR986_04850 [Ignavibacteriota bacterium]